MKALNAIEAAKILDVPISTVQLECRRGMLPARKVGREWRISPNVIEEYLRGEHDKKDNNIASDIKWRSSSVAKPITLTSRVTDKEYVNLLTRKTNKKRKSSMTS